MIRDIRVLWEEMEKKKRMTYIWITHQPQQQSSINCDRCERMEGVVSMRFQAKFGLLFGSISFHPPTLPFTKNISKFFR